MLASTTKRALPRRPTPAFRLAAARAMSRATTIDAPLRFTRPANWKELAPAAASGTTYAAQATLPSLPVPELPETLNKLKETLRPIAWSEEEYNAAVKKIEEFSGKEGLGAELQRRLVEHASKNGNAQGTHWLEKWWDDAGYMGYRDSVIINVSYYYGFDVPKPGQFASPAERAAGIARAALLFRQKLKEGGVPPEATKEGPLCMDTYRWMFDNCRVPGKDGLDFSTSYATESPAGNGTGHIIVLRKNRVWKIQAVAEDGSILSTEDIKKQIDYIYANTTGEYAGVGVLTASNRDVWAADYEHLASSPLNAEILKEIHASAFVLCLDASSPADPIAHSRQLWHGAIAGGVPVGLQNRWADKPLNFVVFDNAYAGLLGEHSVMDGTPTARMCDNILDWLDAPTFDHGKPSPTAGTPTALDFEVTPQTQAAIEKANAAARELAESQAMSFALTNYGKAAIKKFGVSPDSWAQMIVQLAYRRLLAKTSDKPFPQSRVGGTYEAATTRKYLKGRTEAIRVVSVESDRFTAGFDSPDLSVAEKKALFDKAAKTHITRAKAAGQGLGVDRHLFGLKKVMKSSDAAPALFSDPVFNRSSYWVLSTSAIFSKHFPVYGWGEVAPDGYGVAYMTGYDDRLQFTLTSRTEMPNALFMEEIMQASEDLYAFHVEVGKSGGKAKL